MSIRCRRRGALRCSATADDEVIEHDAVPRIAPFAHALTVKREHSTRAFRAKSAGYSRMSARMRRSALMLATAL